MAFEATISGVVGPQPTSGARERPALIYAALVASICAVLLSGCAGSGPTSCCGQRVNDPRTKISATGLRGAVSGTFIARHSTEGHPCDLFRIDPDGTFKLYGYFGETAGFIMIGLNDFHGVGQYPLTPTGSNSVIVGVRPSHHTAFAMSGLQWTSDSGVVTVLSVPPDNSFMGRASGTMQAHFVPSNAPGMDATGTVQMQGMWDCDSG